LTVLVVNAVGRQNDLGAAIKLPFVCLWAYFGFWASVISLLRCVSIDWIGLHGSPLIGLRSSKLNRWLESSLFCFEVVLLF
jgi:hypothetical protein